MDIIIIVAASENNVIGKDNKLIWHLKNDLKRFKALTSGHDIIMGRKTFESFPKLLPNRRHIVITRQKDYKAPKGVIVVSSLKKALSFVSNSKVYVIGGGQIYKDAMSLATTIELTRVHEDFIGDTFFPEIDDRVWYIISEEHHEKDENHAHRFSFITYKRR